MIKYLSILIVLICIVSCNTSNNENAQKDIPANTDSINTIVEDSDSKPMVNLKDSLLIDSIHVDSIPAIKTNYYDLPDSLIDTAKKILNTENLSKLGNESVYILMVYANKFLFDNSSWDIFHKYHWLMCGNLPDWVNSGINSSHCSNPNNLIDNILSYSIFRIDRSPENIAHMYNTYKKWFLSKLKLIPYKKNRGGRIMVYNNIIDLLLQTHQSIIKIEDHKRFLDDFYGKVYEIEPFEYNPDRVFLWQKYGDLGFSTDMLHVGGEETVELWALSFWTRRYHEGNMEVVHEILLDLKKELDKIDAYKLSTMAKAN